MRPALLALLFVPTLAFAQGAPFCVASGAGTQCMYYDLGSCQSAARTFQGMCVANQQQPAPQLAPQPRVEYNPPVAPVMRSPNIMGGFMAGAAAGQAARQSREEYEARMALLQAQTAAAGAQAPAPQRFFDVTFLCDDGNGGVKKTHAPELGCIVVEIK